MPLNSPINLDRPVATPATPPQERRSISLTGSRPLTFHSDGFSRNPLTRHVAVEVEVYSYVNGSDVNETVSRWPGMCAKTDGSLPESGREITTAPAAGDRFLDQIEDLTSALAVAQARVNSSCGLHVHVDARDYDASQIRRLLLVWNYIEPVIQAILAPERRENQYCRTMGTLVPYWFSREFEPSVEGCHDRIVGMLESLSYGAGIVLDRDARRLPLLSLVATHVNVNVDDRLYTRGRDIRPLGESGSFPRWWLSHHVAGQMRYRSLNLAAWFKYGTIEFRCHQGSVKYNPIVDWSLFLGHIVERCQKMTEDEFRSLVPETPSRSTTDEHRFAVIARLVPAEQLAWIQTVYFRRQAHVFTESRFTRRMVSASILLQPPPTSFNGHPRFPTERKLVPSQWARRGRRRAIRVTTVLPLPSRLSTNTTPV
jgi:hypothetical protein